MFGNVALPSLFYLNVPPEYFHFSEGFAVIPGWVWFGIFLCVSFFVTTDKPSSPVKVLTKVYVFWQDLPQDCLLILVFGGSMIRFVGIKRSFLTRFTVGAVPGFLFGGIVIISEG